MKKNLTELVFVVDRSGSMCGLEDDTVGGLNATLQRNREIDGECIVSIVLFDNKSTVLVDRKPIGEVKNLTRRQYQPGGCTALLDAVGDAVRYIDRVQTILPEEYRAEHVMFSIITDGMENASRHRSYEEVKRMIETQQERGWEFVFLGANIDAVGEAARIGISADRAATYIADGEGSAVMFEGLAKACVSMRCASAEAPMGADWKRSIEEDVAARG